MTRGHLPIGWGVRVMLALRSFAEGNVHALPWAEPRSEAMEALPTPSAKNTWAMATGRVRDAGVVVDVVVVVVMM